MPAGRRYPVKKNMKKRNTNGRKPARKKNPYRAGNKKATAKMLQPIAEGRKLPFLNDTDDIKIVGASTNDGWQVLIPNSWKNMYREQFLETLDKSPTSKGFTGNTLFSRFLTQQIKIKFNDVLHISMPAGFHVVYGWCRNPYITAEQSIGASASTNVNNVLIEHSPEEMIARNLATMYNKMFPTTDRQQFKLMYNRRFQVAGQSVNTVLMPASQVRKDLNYRITWKPNTKYHMRPATTGNGNDSAGNPLKPDEGTTNFTGPTPALTQRAYWTPSSKKNGDLFIPFFAIRLTNPENYGKNKDGMSDTNAFPRLYQKNTHYFYDI